ncbi:hypothetical protein [Microbacterium lacticum]
MTTPMLEAPTDFTSFELADWTEIYMVLNEAESLSRSALTRLFPAGQSPDGAELDQLFGEIRRRAEIAPNIYPFRDQEESIVRAPEVDERIYRLLLVLSIEGAPFRAESRFNEINPAFELITREALLSYMGGTGRAVRFGWPNGDGRPEHLGAAVEWLASEMGLAVGVVWDDVDDADKDGGIDVAAWRPFADRSPSFSVWLAQCIVQSNYERKAADIKPEMWMAWIQFGQPPEKVLSIPYAIPLDAKIRGQLRYSFNVVLDRLRLCELLDQSAALAGFDEYDSLQTWADAELAKTREALSTPTARVPHMAKRRRPRRISDRAQL